MSLWLERVRAALAPKGYDVEREVASGGMGSVCLARHRVLGHQVAIKIIRPELHTAQAAERFRREAAILARIRHPNVVPVHDADEADGLPYYVMDFLEGQTLATRLRDGPLSPTEALKLGRDLLDALAAAHRHGVVHRDVKPANVFVVDGRAVLVDFGVAKPLGAASGADATAPGAVVGTFRYMAPEQLCGGDITPRTDVYAAALVIYEAYTGRLWDLAAVPRRADWRGVPRRVARVLACALALAPEERWSDATTFRRALWHTRVAPYRWRTGWLTAGGLVAGALASAWLAGRWAAGRPPFGPAGFELHVVPFEPLGAADRTLAGAVADGVARGLAGHVDFSVAGPAPLPWFVRRSTAVLGGSVVRSGDSLRVALELRAPGWGRTGRVLEARGTVERLDRVVDTLVYGVVREVWNRENPLDPSLPLAALPRSSDALVAWLGAERLLAAGRWRDADSAYGAVEALDSACWLCAWRHAQVGQWLGRTADAGEAGRYLRHAEAFPPKYQALMRAQALGLAARLEALAAAARTWRDFFLGWFMLGDETFHRGPLVGRPRGGAVEMFQQVVTLRPDFAPGWEHLAWALAAEGDSGGAAAALQRVRASPEVTDAFGRGVRALLEVGFAWRFLPVAEARATTRAALADPGIASVPDVAAGPRYLLTFDAPRGAVEMGREFGARRDRPELVRSGLVAATFGYVALGRPDSALAAAAALADRVGDPDAALLAPELAAVLRLADRDTTGPPGDSAVRAGLALAARARFASAAARRGAAWLLLLLGPGPGEGDDPPRALLAAEPPPRALSRMVVAAGEAWRGDPARALATTDSLTALSAADLAAAGVTDPFFRTVLHLSRARWLAALGRRDDAARELLWYQANDYVNLPTGAPQAGDADAAFGTLARWRLAALRDAAGERGETVCRAYRDVARLWAAGETPYGARADNAARRAAALACPRI